MSATRRRRVVLQGVVVAAVAVLGATACGGGARQASGRGEATVPPTCAECFSERWEVPPMGIGATPPENTAPIEAIEAFEDPSGAGSGASLEGSGG